MTRRIGPGDPACGFRCGKHALDDYFVRHALPNDQAGIGTAYVLEASSEDVAHDLPTVLGFYTLSMAAVVSSDLTPAISKKLPATRWQWRSSGGSQSMNVRAVGGLARRFSSMHCAAS